MMDDVFMDDDDPAFDEALQSIDVDQYCSMRQPPPQLSHQPSVLPSPSLAFNKDLELLTSDKASEYCHVIAETPGFTSYVAIYKGSDKTRVAM
jgi:hypothetical protein